ncbi:MAG: C25 family cysteine peptidase [Polyangiales bacterium]
MALAACSLASSQAGAQCALTCAAIVPGCNPVTCPGGACFGTAGPDCINGTAGNDTIFGLGGGDCICAEGGDDTVFAGAGDDFVFGGPGTDNINGEAGADNLFGEDGGDVISGGDGPDFLFGDAGSDILSGDAGDDQLFGDAGDDTLNGGADNDTLFGGTENDTLNGGIGNDSLSGQAGADILRGDDGDDQLSGGTENDQLFGGNGADSLSGDTGDDLVNGEAGDDPQLDGGDGEDTINGGAGNDTANGGPGLDFISGGPDNDTLNGGDGPDLINGDGGDDVINGNADNDTLDGGVGINTVNGNAGYDRCLNFTFTDGSCELLTHATLESFSAFEANGAAVVRWVTSSETGTVGFYLYRELDGEWEAVHEGILPGLLDAPQGGVYDFRDDPARTGASERYLLVEVDLQGVQSSHGPFDVTFDSTGETILEGDARYARQPHPLSPIVQSLKAADSERQRAGDAVALYLGVEATGLYAVSAAEVAARLGLDETMVRDRIQTGELLLTEEGQPVAWSGSTDGAELRFFGRERESLYTTERIYRLAPDTGIVMAEQSAAPGTLTDGLTYEATLHLEENEIPGVLIGQDPDQDYWFWQLISAAPAMPQTAMVTFDLEAVAGGGNLRVDLHGISGEVHSVDVRLNGALVGTTQFEGVIPHSATFSFPQADLREGENILSIEPSEPGDSVLYLDSADVSYTRGYATVEPSLLFRGSQDASIEVTGLTGEDPELLDVTDPLRPTMLTGTVATPTGLQLSMETDHEYFALTATEVRIPSSIWNDVPSNLRSSANSVSYLVIAPTGLLGGAQELADYREAEGLVSMVVELQDIYDEFAFGTPDPNAIRAFLAYAHDHWATAPEFVVLAGKGSLDYRDILGLGGNLLPPLMVRTPASLVSSDTRYADFLGDDGLPDVPLGRLSVTSEAELDSIVQQIIRYEDSIDAVPNDITLLADATVPEGNFGAASDSVIDVLPNDWTATAVYRSELGDLESTRALFFDEVRKGPRMVTYLGHAGITSLGLKESLFGIQDLETMTIDGTEPVFAAMTCVTSRFEVPGLVSLGEAMLIDEEGAIAVWGPSGVSINEQATMLTKALVDELSTGGETRLGPMVTRAFGVVADLEFGRDMTAIYNLLGDPALRVGKADDSSGTGGSGGAAGADGSGGDSENGGSIPPEAGLNLSGCNVGWSEPGGNGGWLLLLTAALALGLRRRRRLGR